MDGRRWFSVVLRGAFRAAISRHMPQRAVFDYTAVLVSSQHPELSGDAARRLTALMLATEPLDLEENASVEYPLQDFALQNQALQMHVF
jgi:hypothetical protein